MRVAVTGVGGGVGQSVMKALSISSLPVEVCAVDVQPHSAGLYRGAEKICLPAPESSGAMDVWERAMVDKSIDALIPGSDHDLLPLAAVRDEWEDGGICKVLVSDLELVQMCRDKAVTCQFLEGHGIPVPKSVWDLSSDEARNWAKSMGYPVMLKPRDGFASRNVNLISDEEELDFFYKRTPKPMLQEYLCSPAGIEEFTCAVFVANGVPVGTFMARRELSGGATYRAEVGFWPDIHELLLAIGSAVRPRGVLNVQLRRTPRGPVPFELNIRCSGTSAVRAYYGFNEPEMLLRHYVLGEELTRPSSRKGYVMRYWNEVFLEDITSEGLTQNANGLKGKVLAWP